MHGGSGATRTGSGSVVQAQPSVLSLPARWKGHQPAGAGLSNLGNSCYLNSTLQCLAYVPPLAHLCLARGHSASCPRAAVATPGAARPGPVAAAAAAAAQCTFCIIERQLAAQLRGSRAIAVSPSEVVRHLHLFSRSFVRGRQEDSHELLTAVLDVMEREGRRAAVAQGAPKGCRTIVEELFLGRWQSQVRCLACGHESNTYESFATLPLDIGQARTVTEGLRAFTEAERLDGNNKYKCDKCRQLVPALKQTTIWDDPNVVVLHLKRFDAGALLGKVSRHVAFGEALDLGPFMTPPAARRRAMEQHHHHHQAQQQAATTAAAPANGHHHHHHRHLDHHGHHHHLHHHHGQGHHGADQQADGNGVGGAGVDFSQQQLLDPEPDCGRSVYGLTGVLVHQGSTLHSGHYYAFVRDSNGGWSCMNDSHVYGTSLDQVRQEQAYLLFYTRQSMKMPRPVPAPPPAATPAAPAAEGPQLPPLRPAAAAAAAAGPARQVYGPQLPPHMTRGSVAAATANGSVAPGGAGEGPLPQRAPSRLNPAAAPSARLPAKVVISPRSHPVAAPAAPAAAVAAAGAAPGAAAAAAAAAEAAATATPLANGRASAGCDDVSRRPNAAASVSGGGASAAGSMARAPAAGTAVTAAAAAAPEARTRKRVDGDAGGGGGGSSEEEIRSAVQAEAEGLKACASFADGKKRLRTSLEGLLRGSAELVADMRERIAAMKREGMSLAQVLALPRSDPRRKALDRLVPQGVLQQGAGELRKLLRPLLQMLAASLGGPVWLMLFML